MRLYVIFGVDGDLSQVRAVYTTPEKAFNYVEENGDALNIELKYLEEGELENT